ncbi:MAG: hypothetical protein Q9220_001092 [cf. Caloplaca sp. 1 TL-2023]
MATFSYRKVHIIEDFQMTYKELYPFSLAEAGAEHTAEDLQELLYEIDWEKNKNMRIREIRSIQALLRFVSDGSAEKEENPTEFEERRAKQIKTYLEYFKTWSHEATAMFAAQKYKTALENGRELRLSFRALEEYPIQLVGFAKYWTRFTDQEICWLSTSAHSKRLYDRLPLMFRLSKWIQVPTRLYWWTRHAKYMNYMEFIDIRGSAIEKYLDECENALPWYGRPPVK